MKKIYVYTLINILLFFSLSLSTVFAKQIKQKYISKDKLIEIETSISTSTLIGDIINYKINIEYSPKILINETNPISTLQNFEIKDYSFSPPKKKNLFSNKIIKKYSYKISTFTKGQFKVYGVEINYKFQDQNLSFKIPDINITVKGLFDENKKNSKLNKNKMFDIKNLEKIYSKKIIISIIIFIIIFGPLVIYYFLFYRKKLELISKKNLLPHEIAFSKLKFLKETPLVSSNEIKIFYITLSEILREYLENRYNIEILEKTTMEIFQELKKIGFQKKDAIELRDVMSEMDLVKFAKYIPENELINQHLNFVYDYVDKTKIEEKIKDDEKK